ncbi:C-GCAxxG-C-C family protein [Eggerthella guodeyinii]|uniref:C-GCAxxG-C-C family protein n=1 Tax=Eggerthella guodeyinii TaxID=2690837 RepID=UPI0018A1BEB7|nr:C-GCAxxG-C-C family protein [Eggerthella guodeyinii]
MGDKAKEAVRLYAKGCTCAQSVLVPFADELGLDEDAALKLAEGYGGGFAATQEMCGAMVSATAIVSHRYSTGVPGDLEGRAVVFGKVCAALGEFEQKYHGVTCFDVLKGERPVPFKCAEKVKDAALIVEKMQKESDAATA